jgi:gamma-glutamylcyclotransferase (GGCT)/AIG2-like uncharacterized protein YtfP
MGSIELKKGDLMLFYGSLRKGHYNYKYFANGLKYIKTIKVPYYKLYSLGAYPGIKPTTDSNDLITCDLMEVTCEDVAKSIHRMELGAGYSYKFLNVNEDKKAIIYEYEGPVRETDKATSGDWSEYESIYI